MGQLEVFGCRISTAVLRDISGEGNRASKIGFHMLRSGDKAVLTRGTYSCCPRLGGFFSVTKLVAAELAKTNDKIHVEEGPDPQALTHQGCWMI